jgi:virginiamycin A acetyltransferase
MFLTTLVRTAITRVVNARLRFEQRANQVVVGRDVEGLHSVQFEGQNGVGRGTIFAGEVSVGLGTTIGANCHIHGPAHIGRYCQLGPAVALYGRNHSLTHITTYVNAQLPVGDLRQYSETAPARIGHDVWLGHGAVVLRGVTIGNGAVVGAGSVVTRSVAPYCIAAGNPARLIRTRFDPAIIELLQQLQWWTWDRSEIAARATLFHSDFTRDPDAALSLLRSIAASAPSRLQDTPS